MAAVSLSGVNAPLLFTVIHGYLLWNPARPVLMMPSSRSVNPLQKEIVTGSLAPVEAELEPRTASASATNRPSASVRFIRILPREWLSR